ncbi:hypothetical protein [Streptomyces sp. NPDC055006]
MAKVTGGSVVLEVSAAEFDLIKDALQDHVSDLHKQWYPMSVLLEELQRTDQEG